MEPSTESLSTLYFVFRPGTAPEYRLRPRLFFVENMSRVPPPVPPTPPPLPGGSPPPMKPAARAGRAQGDLSEAELAALLPPESDEEDEVQQHTLPPPPPGGTASASKAALPPPLHAAVPPPVPGAVKQAVSMVPPPVGGVELPDADVDAETPKRKKSKGLSPQLKSLFLILLGSIVGCALIVLLMVVVFAPGKQSKPSMEPATPIDEHPDETTPGSQPRKRINLDDSQEVDFVDPDHSMIPPSTVVPVENRSNLKPAEVARSGTVSASIQEPAPQPTPPVPTTPDAPSPSPSAKTSAESTSAPPHLSADQTKVLGAHRSALLALAMSPNGKIAATGSNDRTVILWDVSTGKELTQLKGHRSAVTALAFSKNSKLLLTGSGDRTASLWDADSGKETLLFPNHKGAVMSLALSPDASQLVVGVDNGQGVVWDAKTGKPLRPLDEHNKAISATVFSPDGKRVLLASLDRTASLWNPTKGEKLVDFKGHKGPILCAAFDPSGNRIVSGSADKTAIIWGSLDGKEQLKLEGHTDDVTFVAFAPDGSTVYTASKDKTFVQWNARTGKQLVRCQLDFPVALAAISADAFQMIACAVEPKASLFLTESLGFQAPGKAVKLLKNHPFAKLPALKPTLRLSPEKPGTPNPATDSKSPRNNFVTFSPDGSLAVSVGGDSSGVCWSTQDWKIAYSLTHTAPLTSVEFSPDGKYFVVGADDGQILIFQSQDGKLTQTLRGHTGPVNGLAFSANGSRLVSASSDRTLVLWNTATGKSLGALLGHTDKVWGIAVAPDGRFFSASADKSVRLWEPTGKSIQSLEYTVPFRSIVFSPQGDWFATGMEDKTVLIWDAKELKPLKTLGPLPEIVLSLAVKPDDSLLATAGADGCALLWNTKTWEPFRTLPQIPLEVEQMLADPSKLAAVRKIWSKASDQAVGYEPIRTVAFGKGGDSILTSGGVETLLWDLSAVDPAATATETSPSQPATPPDLLGELPSGKPIRVFDHSGKAFLDAKLSRDGSMLVVADESKRVTIYNTADGSETNFFSTKTPLAAIWVSPDSRTLLGGGEDGRLFSIALLAMNKENFASKVHTDRITSIAVNGTAVKAISGGADRLAVLWDLAKKGENLGRLIGHGEEINDVAISRDGSKALTASADKTAILWDTKTLKPLQTVSEHHAAVNGVAFNADGFRFATASQDKTAIVFQTAMNKEPLRLTGSPSPLTCVEFSPNGNQILTGADDGSVVLWDAQTGKPLKRFPGKFRPVRDVSFMSDGKRFLCVTPLGATLWEIGE